MEPPGRAGDMEHEDRQEAVREHFYVFVLSEQCIICLKIKLSQNLK